MGCLIFTWSFSIGLGNFDKSYPYKNPKVGLLKIRKLKVAGNGKNLNARGCQFRRIIY